MENTKDPGNQLSDLQNIFKKGLFTRKRKACVGVDVGSRSVKIVELERGKTGLKLKNYAMASIKKEMLQVGSSNIIDQSAGEIVSKMMKEAGIKGKFINVAIPSFTSLVTVIDLPELPESEINNAIKTEAPRYIPVKLSDVVYDWQVVSRPKKNSQKEEGSEEGETETQSLESLGRMRVLIVAVMKDISLRYNTIFSSQGLNVESLEVDSFSLVRSLIGKDKENCIILDIGHKVCNVVIVLNNNIVSNRTIDVAGDRITKVVAQGMNVDAARAEGMKKDQGVDVGARSQAGGNFLTPTLDLIVEEAKKSMDLVKKDYPDMEIKRAILTGGCSRMIGLQEYIKRGLGGMETIIGDPMSDVEYPKNLEKVVANYSPLLSVAVGLAMLGFDE